MGVVSAPCATLGQVLLAIDAVYVHTWGQDLKGCVCVGGGEVKGEGVRQPQPQAEAEALRYGTTAVP